MRVYVLMSLLLLDQLLQQCGIMCLSFVCVFVCILPLLLETHHNYDDDDLALCVSLLSGQAAGMAVLHPASAAGASH
jgi:hypothetical protein